MDVTHNNVQRVLSMYLSDIKNSQYGSTAILDTLATIAEPTSLIRLMSSIRTDLNVVGSCASRSFLHPLGFDKIMLINCSPIFTLRLHAWWPTQKFAAEHVHNHRFNFLSFVVRGGYMMETFQPACSDGIRMTEYQETPGADGSWELREVGPACIQPIEARALKQGVGYELPSDVLHQVVVTPGTMCLTLFLQTTPTSSATRVYTNPEESAPARTPKKILSATAYRGKLDAIASEIERWPDAYVSSC
jgi:hypothetical protein